MRTGHKIIVGLGMLTLAGLGVDPAWAHGAGGEHEHEGLGGRGSEHEHEHAGLGTGREGRADVREGRGDVQAQ